MSLPNPTDEPQRDEQQEQQAQKDQTVIVSNQKKASSEDSNEQPRPTTVAELVPVGNIAHPENAVTLQSSPGQISYKVQTCVYGLTLDEETDPQGIVTRTGQPWIKLNDELPTQGTILMHVECSFLDRNAFRVRMGLHDFFPFPKPYPTDPDFPPPALRQDLSPPDPVTEPVAGDQREDLVCELELRANDGEIWANPRGSGWELHWESSLFSLSASWQKSQVPTIEDANSEFGHGVRENGDRDENTEPSSKVNAITSVPKAIFEQASLGPFTPTLLPNGILNIEGVLVGSELLILDVGEKIQSGGPGRHRNREAVERIGVVDAKPLPSTARGELSTHFGGRFIENETTTTPPPFLWSNRGWGILMKKPIAVKIAALQDGRAILHLMMLADENGMMEYIVMVHDALEACKQEYPVE